MTPEIHSTNPVTIRIISTKRFQSAGSTINKNRSTERPIIVKMLHQKSVTAKLSEAEQVTELVVIIESAPLSKSAKLHSMP